MLPDVNPVIISCKKRNTKYKNKQKQNKKNTNNNKELNKTPEQTKFKLWGFYFEIVDTMQHLIADQLEIISVENFKDFLRELKSSSARGFMTENILKKRGSICY